MARCLNQLGYECYPSLISQWQRRSSIPKGWWIPIAQAAAKKGLALSLEDIIQADLL